MTADEACPGLAEFYEARSNVYRTFGNGSLRALVRCLLPPRGRLLDVGCASGGLLAGLRDHAGYAVGIELSESAAQAAAEHADHVVVGDVAAEALDIGPTDFDVVVLADVLEHIVEPLPVLKRAAHWCSPTGSIVISIPNVAHWKARLLLLRGRWDYTDSGTFDRGHLRFFTRASIERLVAEAGLRLEHVVPVVPALRNHVPLVTRLPHRVHRTVEARWQMLGSSRPDLLGFQLLVVVSRPPDDCEPLGGSAHSPPIGSTDAGTPAPEAEVQGGAHRASPPFRNLS